MDIANFFHDFLLYFLGDALFPNFANQLVPFLLVALTGAFVLLNLGSSLGVPYLFWHDNRWKQFLVGIFLPITLSYIIFIGFMVDYGGLAIGESHGSIHATHWTENVAWLKDFKPPPDGELPWDIAGTRAFLWYWGNFMLLIGLVSVLVFLIKKTAGKPGPNQDRVAPRDGRQWLPAGFAVGTGIVIVTIFLGTFLVHDVLKGWNLPGDPPDPGLYRWALIAFGLLLLAAVGISVFDRSGLRVSPAVLALIAFSLVAAIFGFARISIEIYFGQKWGAYLLGGLLAVTLTIAGIVRFRYRFRNLDYRKPRDWTQENADREPAEKLLNLDGIEPGPAADKPLVVICTSGGGITAMAWTVAVLNQLEEHLDGFPYAVRMINGASGGMVGAAAWVSTLEPPEKVATPAGDESPQFHRFPREELFRRATEDSLSPAAKRLILHDLPLAFLPLPFKRFRDRGNRLEKSWNDNLDGAMEVNMESLREGEAAGWRPSLVFSPMIVEEGRRLVVSNLDYRPVLRNWLKRADSTDDKKLVSVSAVEFMRMFEEGGKLRLSSSSRMNATFPFVSPTTSLPVKPGRRLIDAGFYDNWGNNLAAGWMLENADAIQKRWDRILVIEIDAYAMNKSSITPRNPEKGGIPEWFARALGGITASFQALISARQAVIYRNDEQMEAIEKEFAQKREMDFTSIRISNTFNAELSWYLTDYERGRIADESGKMFDDFEDGEPAHLRQLKAKTRSLKAWWGKENPGDRPAED